MHFMCSLMQEIGKTKVYPAMEIDATFRNSLDLSDIF